MPPQLAQSESTPPTSILLSDFNRRLLQISANTLNLLRNLFLSVTIMCFVTVSGCSREAPEAKYNRLRQSAALYRSERKLNEARVTLMSAVDIMPKRAEAYFELAEVYAALKNFRKAIVNYQTSLNYDSNQRTARIRLATLLLTARQWDPAEDHIRKLLDAKPDDIDALLLRANFLVSSPTKNFPEAQKTLEGILQRDPKNITALAILSDIALAENKPVETERLLVQALSLQPQNRPLRMALADLYVHQTRLDEAQQILESVIKDEPKNPSLRYLFAEFLLSRGLGDLALDEYKKTIEINPLRHEARDRLYDMYLLRQDKAKAFALADELAKQHPDDAGVNYFRGRTAEAEGKFKQAYEFYLKAIGLMGEFAPAFRRAGLIEMAEGKEQSAVEHLQQAAAINPVDVGSRIALARYFFRKADLNQAAQHVQKLLERYPRQLGANVLKADIALVEGDTKTARAVYQYLIESFPGDPTGYFKLGLLEEREKNIEKAMELYEKALGFDRSVIVPGRRLATLAAASGGLEKSIALLSEYEKKSKRQQPEYQLILGHLVLLRKTPQAAAEARTLFEKAVKARPALSEAYLALAEIDSSAGKLDDAVTSYRKGIETAPDSMHLRMLLALTLEKKGSYAEAAQTYRDILQRNPRFGLALNNLAWLLVAKLNGNLDEALELATSAKEALPQEAATADTLGWVHFRRGSFQIALPLIEEAIELQKAASGGAPPNPEILYHLAEVKRALNDKEGAKAAAEQAIELGGDKFPERAQTEEILRWSASQ